MAGKSYVMKIEVDLDVYNELQAICALHGTTIESATEAFIRFSADPRNIGVLTKYLYAMERIYDIGLSHHLHIQKCINVHDGAYSPWLQLSRKVGAVCAPCTA